MGSRVLLVGAGAREHAVAWKLRQSPRVDEIFVAPGNAGTAEVATNLPITPKDIDGLVKAATDHRIDFYLATMDDPQPLGLVDRLQAASILCYGPSAKASQLESSKAWAKAFMERHGIPSAASRTFSDYREARAFVEGRPDGPLVVKASGLAAGKGAMVCNSTFEVLEALDISMVRKDFGVAGETVVIEERLAGWEASAHAFCDGKTAVMMPYATDYKRAGDGDIGLNTGGMGSYSPSAGVDAELGKLVFDSVVQPTIAGMAAEGIPFNGTLFPGLMVTPDGLRVLEYNARFGDPETQSLMVRLESDLFEICEAAAHQRLADVRVAWSNDAAVSVVLASGGYPATYKLGYVIDGLDAVDPDVRVFHAGTRVDPRGTLTYGGRVLTVTATGKTIPEARARAYDNARRIRFADMFYRKDIGAGAGE
ncbi:MAG: phosphoribosylamine--glycine ligase [Dehalococcoidia bacterium]